MSDLPIPKYRHVATAADANIAAAALDFAAGRRAEAEQRLRETINAGFLMIDDSRLMVEAMVGLGTVKKARAALATLFEMSNRALEAKFLSMERDATLATGGPVERRRPSVEEVSAEVRRMILDEQEVRAVRWELLFWVFAAEPCSDLHQVVFGADALHRATYESARTSLIRNASDSLMFLVFDRNSDRPPAGAATSQYDWRRHQPLARAFTALTGSRQLEACLGLFGG